MIFIGEVDQSMVMHDFLIIGAMGAAGRDVDGGVAVIWRCTGLQWFSLGLQWFSLGLQWFAAWDTIVPIALVKG